MKVYIPSPLDTSEIELSEDLLSLTERLAENVHDNWAKQCQQDGWKWGEHHNDKAKTHPSLVPYNLLSESEKVYDRRTAMETVKAVMVLGYKVHKY